MFGGVFFFYRAALQIPLNEGCFFMLLLYLPCQLKIQKANVMRRININFMEKLLVLLFIFFLFSNCKKEHSNSGGGQGTLHVVCDTAGVHDTAFSCRNDGYFYKDSTSMIVIPNAFTPNGDGINDIYGVFGGGLTDFKLQIKDTSDSVVFQTGNINEVWRRDTAGPVDDNYFVASIYFTNWKGQKYLYILYINLYGFQHPDCLTREAMNCKFGDMADPRYGFIYPTTEVFCP